MNKKSDDKKPEHPILLEESKTKESGEPKTAEFEFDQDYWLNKAKLIKGWEEKQAKITDADLMKKAETYLKDAKCK